MTREPFIPVRIHLQSGKHYDVPFREVAHVLGYGVLVFIGLKQGSVQAKGYDRFPFEHIVKLSSVHRREGRGREKRLDGRR